MTRPTPRPGLLTIKGHMLAQAGLDGPPVAIALNSNESAFGPSPRAIEAARAAVSGIERYFEEPHRQLAPAIAEAHELDADRIAIGHGSDDLLARLARAYLAPGSELVRSANGYPKVPNYALANDAVAIAAPDEALKASVEAILARVGERTRMVYLANPDNPSGTYLSESEVRRLHAGLPGNVLLVLDCAYAEYADAADYSPGHRLVEEAENVVVTHTFSKIHGLAGARVGWLYGPRAVVDAVMRIGMTFPVASPSLAAAMAAIGDREHARHVRETTIRLRGLLTTQLAALGLAPVPSQGNFVLVRFPKASHTAAAASDALRRGGIAVRRFAAPAYDDCIRITIGREAEIGAAVLALQMFLEGGGNG
ncbi:MAG: aminotransferase class I/II-fold pyridoxal phosphate-dependent enzyme [Rhizobiales bacterium]|nr:aminotransferase class I/II-fold pyridoxal phosphate-dependent enzyme [Hyphomicrobiales bacterium]